MTLTEAQEAWLKALESGRFKQGVGRLKTGDYYCCLGVACEIQPDVEYDEVRGYGKDSDRNTQVLPEFVRERLGLRGCDGSISGSDKLYGFSMLASANDAGVSFEQIAAYIRINPENVFKEEDGH